METTEWRTFTFGEDLVCSEGGERVETYRYTGLKEEGLETLLTLNLRTLFPEWELEVRGTSADGWGVADLVAVDPGGALHMFELKYGTSGQASLLQVVSYALGAAARTDWSEMIRSRPHWTPAYLARRMLGVTRNEWTDKMSADKNLTEREKDLSRLDALVGQENRSRWIGVAEAKLASLFPPERVPALPETSSRCIHLHLVVPGLSDDLVKQAAELARRSVRVSLWDARACVEDRQGRISIREVPIPAPTKKQPDRVATNTGAVLYNEVVKCEPSLARLDWGADWSETSCSYADQRATLWLKDRTHAEGGGYGFVFSVRPEASVWRLSGRVARWWSEIERERPFVRDLLGELFPPPEGTSPHLGQYSKPVNYVVTRDGCEYRIWRSGHTGMSCSVEVPGSLSVGEAATRLAPIVRHFWFRVDAARAQGLFQPFLGDGGEPAHAMVFDRPESEVVLDEDSASD